MGKWIILGLTGLSLFVQSGATSEFGSPAYAQAKKITVFVTRAVPAPEGAILRLDTTATPAKTVSIVEGLETPRGVSCGPDKHLYVHEALPATGGRIVRFGQDGSSRTVLFEHPALSFTSIVFSANGDLWFGLQGQGVWRLKGADPLQRPELVLGSLTAGQRLLPQAFLTAGPFEGDLLLIDSPPAQGDRGGRVVRAKAPDYKTVEEFVPASGTFLPVSLALHRQGDVFVANFGEGSVLRFGPDGQPRETFALVRVANQIAIDSTDTVWVTSARSFPPGGPLSEGALIQLDAQGNAQTILERQALVRGVTVCEE
jgi:hypothetical protein